MQIALLIICLMFLMDGLTFLLMPEHVKAWLDEVSPSELRIIGVMEAAIALSGILVAFLS